ncbi:molybdenum cofactor biosynthesis protein B [Marinobacterium sp. xm-d-530]|uniref:molybdenum cofactor biosynthesis protein B n=1 Tax=Marinobacterium sp. xm-d-530 TaxID=2497747 RepID=UPI001569648F|nr:molybdenum cofactor biosynthesis protein B [Marinobacterium sp. xm-d-530]NRQ01147.1 Molybdenum cofactor biosynthesis protein B [Marinobacterium sp. xm-d-530]
MSSNGKEFVSLNVAVLTVSDTRNESNDTSGDFLANAAVEAGHTLIDRALLPDDVYLLRAQVSHWIADPEVQVVLSTGGTGFALRDSTPEALKVLFDKEVEGFGEMFRKVSWDEIGTSTIQSRVFAGLANGTLIVCMPGSTGACRTGWSIIESQLDNRHRPCNFVALLEQVKAQRLAIEAAE